MMIMTADNGLLQDNKRIFGLDLVRAAAIILVVINHAQVMLLPLRQMPYAGWLLGKLMALTIPFGLLGVELFFVLSGYLIGSILIRSFLAPGGFGRKPLLHFWKMRWMRTLPLYFTILLLNILLNRYLFHQPIDWRYFVFLQNFCTPHPDAFGEAWSLSVEEWSYLLLGIVFFIVHRVRQQKKVLLTALLAYLTVAMLLRLVNAFDPVISNFDWGIRKMVIFRLDAVGWGVLMAYVSHFYPGWLFQRRKSLVLTGITGLITITGLNYFSTHPAFNWYYRSPAFCFCTDAFFVHFIPGILFFIAALFRYPASAAQWYAYGTDQGNGKAVLCTVPGSSVRCTSLNGSLYPRYRPLCHIITIPGILIIEPGVGSTAAYGDRAAIPEIAQPLSLESGARNQDARLSSVAFAGLRLTAYESYIPIRHLYPGS